VQSAVCIASRRSPTVGRHSLATASLTQSGGPAAGYESSFPGRVRASFNDPHPRSPRRPLRRPRVHSCATCRSACAHCVCTLAPLANRFPQACNRSSSSSPPATTSPASSDNEEYLAGASGSRPAPATARTPTFKWGALKPSQPPRRLRSATAHRRILDETTPGRSVARHRPGSPLRDRSRSLGRPPYGYRC
jgi:hypothetical protein